MHSVRKPAKHEREQIRAARRLAKQARKEQRKEAHIGHESLIDPTTTPKP
jgi:hypothetical protein